MHVTLFTDPACPFAFSAEPVRRQIQWHYGDQLEWTIRMVVLTLEPGESERLAEGAPGLQRKYGMPIDPRPYARPFSSEPACLSVVAARLHAPDRVERFLRRLRVRAMLGELLDDPEMIAAAAEEAGVDPAANDGARAALDEDIAAARDPSPAARLLDHKLGGPREQRRYTTPSYVLGEITVPGFNPMEAYDVALAAQGLTRRPKPESVTELLEWAGEPLATAEVIAVMGRSEQHVRAELSRHARAIPAGADCYWAYGS
jgi:2-hydroxychromene-2-carboxylate isomerase